MRWFFQASVSDCSNPRLCRLLLCILPSHSRFTHARHIQHTGSSAHLSVPCLRPSISNCHTRSFSHLVITRIRPSIPITHPEFLSLLVAVLLHAHLPTTPPPQFSFPRVFQGGPKFFSGAYWRHCIFLLLPPPSYPVSFSHTSNKGRSATHCAMAANIIILLMFLPKLHQQYKIK